MASAHPPLRPFTPAHRSRLSAPEGLPLPTGREAAAFDAWAMDEAGVPHFTLMENAGRSAALLLNHLHPEGKVLALVGAGNNGGDALVLLRNLAAWGREVEAVLVADRDPRETILHGWDLPRIQDSELAGAAAWDRALAGASVVVDGILGTGLSGPPRERQARAIEAANRAPGAVVALDVPSGVDADTGAVPGAAVRARLTLALGWPKLGTVLHPGRAWTGRLLAVEIGFPGPDPDRFSGRLITPVWARSALPRRDLATHKNAVGNLLVVAGREGMAGAAVLAARAAIRSGAGYVRVASEAANREIVQEAVPDAVFVDRADPAALEEGLGAASAVLVGPGMGTDREAGEILERILRGLGARPVLLDADALTLLGHADPERLRGLGASAHWVLTPHPGEMARLDPGFGDAPPEGRPGRAVDYARSRGVTVVLKGSPSVVASAGPLRVDAQGSSDLAAAGMGDTLSGCVAALLAQGVPGPDAAALGLYLTGRSARRAALGPGLSPTDVVEGLPAVLSEEVPREAPLPFPFLLLDMDAPR